MSNNTDILGQKYDLIGDIHGYATLLKELLTDLGYSQQDGVYRHPERQMIFLGDYIDRGPGIRETLQIVRAMVDAGSALAIMGNHEFNAMAYHTPDGKGGYLRKHTPEKVEQHRATMEQIGTPYPDEWKGWLDWFSTLPLFLDLGGLRAVHTAWNAEAVRALQSIKRIDEDMLRVMADESCSFGKYKKHLLNGLEVMLPEGRFFTDKAGNKQKGIRTRWWEPLAGKTYRQVIFPASDTVPDIPIPGDLLTDDLTYGIEQPPVFIGHYGLPPDAKKRPMAVNVACLDYSVANGGELVVYRSNEDREFCDRHRVVAAEGFWTRSLIEEGEMYHKALEGHLARLRQKWPATCRPPPAP